MEQHGIRLVAVGGSVRTGNFTSKALALVLDEMKRHHDVTFEEIDLGTLELPPLAEGNRKTPRESRNWFPKQPGWFWPPRNITEVTAA